MAPAGALSGRGTGWSRVAEAPGTFPVRFEKFVYRNFQPVKILRFTTPPLLTGLSLNLFSFCEDSPKVLGGNGRQDFHFYGGTLPKSNLKSRYPGAQLQGLGRATKSRIEIPRMLLLWANTLSRCSNRSRHRPGLQRSSREQHPGRDAALESPALAWRRKLSAVC